ncbi:hypothetical protein P692DRAFT_20877771 [Suillus brevipes Sb2]|nr:hypothetical protein P692DRAFT_20877771 [Suillus brevipes Sb2]
MKQLPPSVPAVTGQSRKRGHEESLLGSSENGAKKIPRNENDGSQPITAQAGSINLKGSKRKTKANSKTDGDSEQVMAQLEDLGHWSDDDTKLLLETLLGGDSEFYKYLAGKSKHVFKKVSVNIFKGRRSSESAITGNGGGDPDTEELDEKIEKARSAGKDVGNLSGTTLKKCLGEHPGLVREKEFRSGTISDTINISDEESNASNSEGGNSDDKGKNSGTTRKPNATQSQPAKKLKSASTVVEKKVKPSSQKGVTAPQHKWKASSPANISNEAAEFFSSNVEFLKATVHSDTEHLKLLKSREIREENQHNFMVEKE